MSEYNTSSFETDYEYNGQVWTAGGSSQSTQTSSSSFDYDETNYSSIQPRYIVQDNTLFSNVGHGAPDSSGALASSPNIALGNEYSLPDTQALIKSYYEASWSQYARWKAYGPNPYPAAQASAAQGSRGLGYNAGGAYAFQNAPINSSPSERDVTASQQSYPVALHDLTTGRAPVYRPPTPSSRSGQMLIPKASPQFNNERATSSIVRRFPCSVPGCPEWFTRSEDAKRHEGTVHSTGPFLVCNRCPHWDNEVRRDKMRAHCRERHAKYIEFDLTTNEDVYPYQTVASIGDRDRILRTSTAERLVRRRRKPPSSTAS